MMKTIYKISAVDRDWKASYTAKHVSKAIKFCGEDAEFTDVNDTGGDFYIMICASPPITDEQAQELYNAGDLCICEEDFEGTWDEIIKKVELLMERV